MARQTVEPIVWLLFSAGGVLSALFMPSVALLFGIAFPLGWVTPPDYTRVLAVVQHPLTRLTLFALCTLSLFHFAHRFRFTLYDGLQIKHLNELINTLCYGIAIGGSVYAGYLLLRIG